MSSALETALLESLGSIGAELTSLNTSSGHGYSIEAHAQGNVSWALKIVFHVPLTGMPTVHLCHMPTGLGLAHVNYKGEVCYSDHEGEAYDPENVANVVAWAVSQAVRTLDSSLERKLAGDFQELLDEFEGYWSSLDGCTLVTLFDPADGHDLRANVGDTKTPAGSGKILFPIRIAHTGSKHLNGTAHRVRFFALKQAIRPPPNGIPVSAEWLNKLFALGGEDSVRVSQSDGPHIFLFSQPRSGGEALFGLAFTTRKTHGNTVFSNLKPFCIQRAWREYMLNRTGSEPVARSVAILGCGAVGGRVAEQLALAGVDELILVDGDRLSYDNTYRHVLGAAHVGAAKVEALKLDLEAKFPGVKVAPFFGSAEQWLQDPLRRDKCDTLVLTTGKSALERHITRRAFSESWPQRLIAAWLEPFGLGGHAVAAQAGTPGCLECLFTDIGERRTDPSNAFLAPNQPVSRNITGCGGRFMPYSALHASETALLVCKAVLSNEHGYRCWVGDPSAAIAEGFKVTPRHDRCWKSPPTKAIQIDHSDCPCCSS